MSSRQAALLHAARQHALEIGTPLDRHLTLRIMSVPGGLLAGTPSARGRVLNLLDRFRRAAETRVGWFAGVWVREWDEAVGEHLHLAFHGNADLDRALPVLLERWTGAAPDRHGLRASPRNPCLCKAGNGVWEIRRHVAELGGDDARLVAYLLKSATTTDGRGPVDGKRAGTSRVLGRAARLQLARETVSQAISTKSERA